MAIDFNTAQVDQVLIALATYEGSALRHALACIAERDNDSLIAGGFLHQMSEYITALLGHVNKPDVNHEVVRCLYPLLIVNAFSFHYATPDQYTYLHTLLNSYIHMQPATRLLALRLVCNVNFLLPSTPNRLVPVIIRILLSFEGKIPGKRRYGPASLPLVVNRWITTIQSNDIDIVTMETIFEVLKRLLVCSKKKMLREMQQWMCLVYAHLGRPDLPNYNGLLTLMRAIITMIEEQRHKNPDIHSQFYFDLLYSNQTRRFLDLLNNPPLHDTEAMMAIIELWSICIRYLDAYLVVRNEQKLMTVEPFLAFAQRIFVYDNDVLKVAMFTKWSVLVDKLMPLIKDNSVYDTYMRAYNLLFETTRDLPLPQRVADSVVFSWCHLVVSIRNTRSFSEALNLQICYSKVVVPLIENLHCFDGKARRHVIYVIAGIHNKIFSNAVVGVDTAKIWAFVENTFSIDTARTHLSFWKKWVTILVQDQLMYSRSAIKLMVSTCASLFYKPGCVDAANDFALALEPLLYLVKSEDFVGFLESAEVFANPDLSAMINRCDTSTDYIRLVNRRLSDDSGNGSETDEEDHGEFFTAQPVQPSAVKCTEDAPAPLDEINDGTEGLNEINDSIDEPEEIDDDDEVEAPSQRDAKRTSRNDDDQEQQAQRRRKTFYKSLDVVLSVADEDLNTFDLDDLRLIVARFNLRIHDRK